MKQGQLGVTLIEMLIVVGILGILAALSVPNLMRSRMTANEIAAVGGLKTIATGQTDYNNNSTPHSYSRVLVDLGTGAGAGNVRFIDMSLANGFKMGYTYDYQPSDAVSHPDGPILWSWSATAWPILYQITGKRSFYVDDTGVIRARDSGGKRIDFTAPSFE